MYSNLTRTLFLLYCVWILLVDKAPWTGTRKCNNRGWQRAVDHFSLSPFLQEYIPFKLVRTVELDPETEGPFLFALHPHAVLGYSFWCNFTTDCTQFSNIFKGIEMRLCTLNLNFMIPFARELLLMKGFISVDKTAIITVLNSGKDQAVGVVVGGAAEAQYAYPGMNSIVLKKRKGFIKLALQTGLSDLLFLLSKRSL